MTTLTDTEKEAAALKRVENAARRVIRYPDDRQPRQALAAAIRNLDKTRRAAA